MKCYIREILIYNNNGERRSVAFTEGLNVITGESKTGKSALIEIVDYCLCSKNSSIPQGKVYQFGYLYAIIISFKTKHLVIGRKRLMDGGNYEMFFKVETKIENIQNIQFEYFKNLTPQRIKNGVQTEIEKHLGLAVSEMSSTDDSFLKKGKASLRNMTPFLFQHQNLIANKHALFYRFDNNERRKATISEFPVFAGWVDDNYYHILRQLEDKERELRQHELLLKKKKDLQKRYESELKGYFKNYYSLIGKVFDDTLSFDQLLRLKGQLPDFNNNSFISQSILNRYNGLMKERDERNFSFTEISRKIKDLENSQKYANEYEETLDGLRLKTEIISNDDHNFVCPTCGLLNDELSETLAEVIESKNTLALELNQVSTYKKSYIKDIEDLIGKREALRKEIILLNTQIKDVEDSIKEVQRQKDLGNKAIYAKAKIDLLIDQFIKEREVVVDDDTEKLKAQIQIFKQQLTAYGVDRKNKEASSFIDNSMNEVCNRLDFEDDLRPPHLHFDLNDFSLTHNDEKIGDITLGEMGSGANWVACHLSLFLSLLEFFVKEERSSIPSFLFLDQPSQVYFPKDFDKEDSDVKQVENIYIAILDKLEKVKKEIGFAPQVIITDHADHLNLGKYKFEDYVRRRWIDKKGLI